MVERADDDAGELLTGRKLRRRRVEAWVHQHLAGEGTVSVHTQSQRDGGRQVAAGALAADGDTTGIDAELLGVRERPTSDGLTVVQACRVRVLGCEAVLDGHDDGVSAVGELAGDVVHDPDAADAEAAAVEVHDETSGRVGVLVDPHADAVDDVIGDRG